MFKNKIFILIATLFYCGIGLADEPVWVDVTGTRQNQSNDQSINTGIVFDSTRPIQSAADAQSAKIRAKAECYKSVGQIFIAQCTRLAKQQRDRDQDACSHNAKVGGVVAFAGAAGLGLAYVLGGPPGWILGTVSFVGGGAGTWYGVDGSTSCRDSADRAFSYNTDTACPQYAKNAQNQYCPN